MSSIIMTDEQREQAKFAARRAAGRIPNGPAAGDLFRAANGGDEDLLLAVHLILTDPFQPDPNQAVS